MHGLRDERSSVISGYLEYTPEIVTCDNTAIPGKAYFLLEGRRWGRGDADAPASHV